MARAIRMLTLLTVSLLAIGCAVEPQSFEIEDARLPLERCPVHDEPLIEGVNEVDWERGQYDPSYYEIRRSLFPCAFNGPTIDDDLAYVNYCPKCRVAKSRYLNDPEELPLPCTQEQLDAYIARHQRELHEEYQDVED